MKRILRGKRGAFVVQMDLGSKQRCEEDGIGWQPRCLLWHGNSSQEDPKEILEQHKELPTRDQTVFYINQLAAIPRPNLDS
jgi:hypothetical protein